MATKKSPPQSSAPGSRSRGFTLVELMISMVLSLLVLSALVSMFVSTSKNNTELQKTNGLIENGRIAADLLQNDLVHAGYWGAYVPQFDDFSTSDVPGDVPAAVPNACAAYTTWDAAYRNGLVGIPLETTDTVPAGPGCLSPLTQRPGTDALVVRHADTCIPGEGNCDADVVGRLYMQTSLCRAESNAGRVQSATSHTITMAASASAVNSAYSGMTIRMKGGVAAGQVNTIASYNGSTKVATMNSAWGVIPGTTADDIYAFEYVLGTTSFPLHMRDCVGTGTPPTLPVSSGTFADKRQFVSNVYYVHDYPHPDRAGEVVPTLVRSSFDLVSGTLAQQAPVALVDGIEGFRVELGIDNVSDSGAAVDYSDAIIWADPDYKISPTNRGDGQPDAYVRCTTPAPCTVDQLTNVVSAKIFVLARSREPTGGHVDNRTYCLGSFNTDGTCPAASRIAAANDSYKRHVFVTSVRLNNISGRRETP